MATQLVDYSDFSAGEYGVLEPWRAPKGTFTGKNVVQYDTGAIGPRNGLIEIEIDPDGDSFLGTILSVGNFGRKSQSRMWVIMDTTGGNKIYSVERDGTVSDVTEIDAVPTILEPVQSASFEGTEYLCIVSEGLYKLDDDADPIEFSLVDDSPGTRCFARWGERFLAAGGGDDVDPVGPDGSTIPNNRVYFSEPGDPEDWPALNYFTLTGAVVGLYPQRSQLAIATTEGWWVLTGVPGVNAVLRKQIAGITPSWPNQGTVVEPSGNVGFVIGSNEDAQAIHSLGLFTGSSVVYSSTLPFGNGQNYSTEAPTYQALFLRGPDDWIVQGGKDTAPNQAAHFRGGSWHKYEWEVEDETLMGWMIGSVQTDRQFVWVNGDDATAPRLFEWQSYNNKPGFASDDRAQPGDASETPIDAEFTLPEWHEENGKDVGITEIVVDFTSWDTGADDTNHFDLVPTVLRTFGETAPKVGGTLSFDEAVASSSETGTRRRIRYQGVARGLDGTGFQLAFSNIRGCAISRVQVLLETDGPRVGD